MLTSVLLFAGLLGSFSAQATDKQKCAPAIEELTSAKPTQTLVNFVSPDLDYHKPTVIVVDGESSGNLLAPAFTKAGFQVIHVHSVGKAPAESYARSFKPQDYKMDIAQWGTVAETLKLLEPFTDIRGVLAGADPSVIPKDILGNALKETRFPNLPIDPVNPVLKDKGLQTARIREMGGDATREIIATSADGAVSDFVKQYGLFENSPRMVVTKPIKSAGTQGFNISHSEIELGRNIERLQREEDKFGNSNAQFLVQEYLEGFEYPFNTVTFDGHTVSSGLWVYFKQFTKDGKHRIYDVDFLLPFEGETQNQIVQKALKTQNDFGIRNQSGHGEYMVVPGRGPLLVEHNARLVGTGIPDLEKAATGRSQVDLLVMAYTKPEAFKKLSLGYKLKKYAAVVMLTNWKSDSVLHKDAEKKLRNIPGYFSHSFHYDQGVKMPLTEDLASALGDIFLLADTQEQLLKSVNMVRRMDKASAFTTGGN